MELACLSTLEGLGIRLSQFLLESGEATLHREPPLVYFLVVVNSFYIQAHNGGAGVYLMPVPLDLTVLCTVQFMSHNTDRSRYILTVMTAIADLTTHMVVGGRAKQKVRRGDGSGRHEQCWPQATQSGRHGSVRKQT